MKTTKVHFSVDPIWFTNFIRSVWSEGSYQKAFNIINAALPNMSEELKFDIIVGKRKLVSEPTGEGVLVKADNWKPNLQQCIYKSYEPKKGGQYPDPVEVRNNVIYDRKGWFTYLDRKYPQSKSVQNFSEEIDELSGEVGAAITQFKNLPMKMFGGYDSLEQMNQAFLLQSSIPTPEQYFEMIESRNERAAQGKPKPDNTLKAEMGWILPDGKFYACLTPMEHIWLADQFGLSETDAE